MITLHSRSTRWIGGVAAAVFSVLVSPVAAQSPQEVVSPPPVIKPVEPAVKGGRGQSASQQVTEMIRKALDGHPVHAAADGILDDVLKVIESQRSVLDGSLLDQPIEVVTTRSSVVKPKPNHSSAVYRPARRAHVAEQLLRSARLMDQLAPQTNPTLVRQLRQQAFEFLSQDFAASDQQTTAP